MRNKIAAIEKMSCDFILAVNSIFMIILKLKIINILKDNVDIFHNYNIIYIKIRELCYNVNILIFIIIKDNVQ